MALPRQCPHLRNIPLSQTLVYCLALSSFFVFSLYAFVPPSVRRLPRDDASHVKWRSGVVLGVAAAGVGAYPLLFCRRVADDSDAYGAMFPPWYRYLGFTWRPSQDLGIALHVLILYLGSFACAWLRVYHYARILHREKERDVKKHRESSRFRSDDPRRPLTRFPKLKYLRLSLNFAWIQPTMQSFKRMRLDEDHRWVKLRNLGVAPLAEEVVFRACLVPPLLVSQTKSSDGCLTPTQASWIAPLFFGVAHVHHLYEQYRRLPPHRRSRKVMFQLSLRVAVQWTYTTLFGAYVSHVFLRTGSLSGVTLAHIICNYMGLPDISFAHPTSDLYRYRWFVMIAYVLGIVLFAMGFDSLLFPSESVIPALLQRSTSQS